MGMESKKCTKCGEDKCLSEFYKDKRRKLSVYPACKLCHNKSAKNWRSLNKSIKAKLQRDWTRKNPNKVKRIKKKHETQYPVKLKEQRSKRQIRQSTDLSDGYVRKVLRETNIPITPETIELKRDIISIKRLIKKQNGKT